MKRVSALLTNDKVKSACTFQGTTDPFVDSVSFDSGTCRPDSVFVAIEGVHVDGHNFIDEALANGACVIIHSKELASYNKDTLYIRHHRPRRIASLICASLFDHVEQRLPIIGVTGTDGKTTTCDYLWQLLRSIGKKCALLSTVAMDDGQGRTASPYRQSTPEVTEIYPFLQRCYANKVDVVVLEATSHGLSDEGARLVDIPFSGAVYTTLTSEHLEFHHTKEAYIEAKLNLARAVAPNGWVVVPALFPYTDRIDRVVDRSVAVRTYSLDLPQVNADLVATTMHAAFDERTVTMHYGTQQWNGMFPFGCDFLAQNALGALLAASLFSLMPPAAISYALARLVSVPGRWELVPSALPFTIIIDFAHTADAFLRLFQQVRLFRPTGRLVALFGAAGERDHTKRAAMGRQAAQWCDAVFLADEDPRGELSDAIFDEIEEGIRKERSIPVFRIADRKKAIDSALRYCASSDTLLLLGKGHERSIQYAAASLPWQERQVTEQLINILLAEQESLHG